ncbi:MAG: polymer-forming cytoskeletal protein [Deltaproteobacteria bacterium]|jgi:cytoskeletal protein CcmA (bactofilin family)|nr:polymer-forming cytoskeletal protein [Deltaproteobacteria bacterium]
MERGKAAGSTSLLSKKVNIVGEIQGNEDLHVEGRFKGSIKITGNIFVGPTGVVEADVEANNITIQGKINGNILARQQLEIQSAGELIGDCSAQSIDIKEGAIFEGRSQMLRPKTSLASTQSGTKGHPK